MLYVSTLPSTAIMTLEAVANWMLLLAVCSNLLDEATYPQRIVTVLEPELVTWSHPTRLQLCVQVWREHTGRASSRSGACKAAARQHRGGGRVSFHACQPLQMPRVGVIQSCWASTSHAGSCAQAGKHAPRWLGPHPMVTCIALTQWQPIPKVLGNMERFQPGMCSSNLINSSSTTYMTVTVPVPGLELQGHMQHMHEASKSNRVSAHSLSAVKQVLGTS